MAEWSVVVIEGFKIDLQSQELVEHLRKKADEHAEKAAGYARQAAGVRELQEPTGASNDPASSLQSSSRSHAARSDYFHFLAEHVIEGETYRLTERELEALEFYSRYAG